MQRQRRYSNHLPTPAIWTQDVSKRTSLPKKRRKTSVERIYPSTPPLLTRLVGNNSLPFNRLFSPTRRRTRTTSKEVFGVEGADKDRVVAMTLLQWVSTPPLLRKKKKMSPKLSATTVTGRDITSSSVPRNQKTSISLGDLHADDWD